MTIRCDYTAAAEPVRHRDLPSARNPPWHVPFVGPVLVAEALDQPRLFQERDVDGVDEGEEKEPAEERPGRRGQRLPEQDEEHPGDHRIADVPVDAPHHEVLRGLPEASVPSPTVTNNRIVATISESPEPIQGPPINPSM